MTDLTPVVCAVSLNHTSKPIRVRTCMKYRVLFVQSLLITTDQLAHILKMTVNWRPKAPMICAMQQNN